MVTQHQHHYS